MQLDDLLSDHARPDPIHTMGAAAATFTTVNGAEALPGVTTPLGWSWFAPTCELFLRRAFCDIGAMRKVDIRIPTSPDMRFNNVFFGRHAGNLDLMRFIGDQMPGSSGEAVEEQYFGGARQGAEFPVGKKRPLPAVLARFSFAAVRSPRSLERLRREVTSWWERSVMPGAMTTGDEARARIREATQYWHDVGRHHAVISMIGQGLFEQVRRMCEGRDDPGLTLRLLGNEGGFEEQRMVADLWDVSRDRLDLDAFVRRWGFHGPAEGELSSLAWREDPSPLKPLVEAYRRKPEDEGPDRWRVDRTGDLREATAELMGGLSRRERLRARVMLSQARKFIPLREIGRGTFLRSYDVARCAARRIGDDLVERGMLADRDDAFYLTMAEILEGPPADARDLVEFRRARRDLYQTLELPERFTGQPVPIVRADPEPDDRPENDLLEGLGVSAGTVQGRAIVVRNPHDAEDLEPGDILVCETTDPSWTTFFFAVSGAVIDVGGPMSHGAIVSRELGIPCVMNTRVGSHTLRTGDRLLVDGSAGTVRVLERVERSA